MSRTLLVGCSFVWQLIKEDACHISPINTNKYTVLASTGSGNQAIAAQTIHEVCSNPYNQVVVIWSGINRVDIPISAQLGQYYQSHSKEYLFQCQIGNMSWFHSGGMLGISTQDSSRTPKAIKNFLRTQYLIEADRNQYLSELSLLSIVSTQAVLNQHKIPYQMGFIYDVRSTEHDHRFEHCHGTLDQQTPLHHSVDWTKFTDHTAPYVWAREQNRLEEDGYHPTKDAMIEWFRLAMNIDLCD
jgi:hypothetical protein